MTINTNTSQDGSKRSIVDFAREDWEEFGWYPLPIPSGRKFPITDEWQKFPTQQTDPLSRFSGGRENRGVILGGASRNLADVDLDCEQAVTLASSCLLPTPAIFGRFRKPRSHWLYTIDDEIYLEFHDPVDKQMLLELRATSRHETVFPGSWHADTGEQIQWYARAVPLVTTKNELVQRCNILASACLFMRAMPEQGAKARHGAAQRLGGFLARCSWNEEQITRFVAAIFIALGDHEVSDRVTAAKGGLERLMEGQSWRVYGLPECNEVFGEIRMKKIAQWLNHPAVAKAKRWNGADPEEHDWHLNVRQGSINDIHNVRWCCPGWFAYGKMTNFIGPTKIGKSILLCTIASIITTGRPWPFGDMENTPGPQPGEVLWVETEDDLEDTTLPRIIAAGGDLTKIHFVDCVVDHKKDGLRRVLDIHKDIEAIEGFLREHPHVSSVILNPLNEFMGTKITNNEAAVVRASLSPLVGLAKRHRVALLCIAHPPKMRSGDALTAPIGSISYSTLARGGILIEEEWEEVMVEGQAVTKPSGRNLMSQMPSTNTRRGDLQTIAYRHETCFVERPAQGEMDGEEVETVKIKFEGSVNIHAQEVWERKGSKGKPGPAPEKLNEAIAFLLREMYSHKDMDTKKDVYVDRLSSELEAARKLEGITDGPWGKAKVKLGVRATTGWLRADALNSSSSPFNVV